MSILQTRRGFVSSASAAGALCLIDTDSASADEAPLETTTIRLAYYSNICLAPTLVAKDLLRAEGFEDIQYIAAPSSFTIPEMVTRGTVDFASTFAGTLVYHLDNGMPITALAGIHEGCYELFAHEPIRSISELRGKSIAIQDLNSDGHHYLAMMAAHVGLDPKRDFNWIISPDGSAMNLFIERKADAFLAFPPEPQELRALHAGRAIISTIADKPWSQYFCCALYGSKDFIQRHPVATRRYLRALLKATDYCADEPKRVAQQLTDMGFARYEYALQTLTDIQYRNWRQFDPEDTMRFYALRLHEVGMIKSSPASLIAEGTDWRFLNELKRELKA
jgi:NitT/TauT family transport system substrate-binding protein